MYATENKLTNIFIGIFTTAWARLELYNLMDLLGENALYVDTDSCIYVSKHDSPKPILGDYLGNLTNEITPKYGPGSYITQFACGGPKNYAYVVNNGAKHCKIRGFTFNFKNSQILNFDSMRNAICKYVSKPFSADSVGKKKNEKKKEGSINVINECKIIREKWTRTLVSKRKVKSYQVVYDKRIILGKGEDTIPFGFNWSPPDNSNLPNRAPIQYQSVPDHILFSIIQPCNDADDKMAGADFMEIDETISNASSVDLMETDSKYDNNYSSENSCDRDFVDDDEIPSEQDVSFYRRLDKSL